MIGRAGHRRAVTSVVHGTRPYRNNRAERSR
jgi:hypothetical protein